MSWYETREGVDNDEVQLVDLDLVLAVEPVPLAQDTTSARIDQPSMLVPMPLTLGRRRTLLTDEEAP